MRESESGKKWLPIKDDRLDKVVCSDKLCHNTKKGTPVTAELVRMHMVKPLRAWFSCFPAVGGARSAQRRVGQT